MDLIERLLALVNAGDWDWAVAENVVRDAIEAIEQLRAQVQMLGKEPVA